MALKSNHDRLDYNYIDYLLELSDSGDIRNRNDIDWPCNDIITIDGQKVVNSYNLPTELDLRSRLPPTRSLADQALAAAAAGAVVAEYQARINTGYRHYMSPEFIYSKRANYSTGMTGRDVMSVLLHSGCVPQHQWGRTLVNPTLTPRRIRAYARVYSIDELRHALFYMGPCYISFGSADALGQAYAVVGYSQRNFILRKPTNIASDFAAAADADLGYVLYPTQQWGKHWEIFTAIDEIDLDITIKFPRRRCRCLRAASEEMITTSATMAASIITKNKRRCVII